MPPTKTPDPGLKPQDHVVFSVIITSYNLGSTLERAILSILEQSLDSIEIIIVDDASDDPETQLKLKKLRNKFTIIHQETNRGVAAARNCGIAKSRGEYILCLDGDDYIASTYLEQAAQIFDNKPTVGIVTAGVQTVGSQDFCYMPTNHESIQAALVNSPVHSASCFRKTDWSAGAVYDTELRGYEDWDHWIRIMKLGREVHVLPEYLIYYYIRDNSKVETSNKNAFALTEKIIENHKELYREHFTYVIARKHALYAAEANRQRHQSTFKKEATRPLKSLVTLLGSHALKIKKYFFPAKWI